MKKVQAGRWKWNTSVMRLHFIIRTQSISLLKIGAARPSSDARGVTQHTGWIEQNHVRKANQKSEIPFCLRTQALSLGLSLFFHHWRNVLSQGQPGCDCHLWLCSERRITLSSLFLFSFWFLSCLCFFSLTVIQDVDSSSLEGSYQSFASLMEQRLAELFLVAGRRGVRIKRATTVGGYTVQVDLFVLLSESML